MDTGALEYVLILSGHEPNPERRLSEVSQAAQDLALQLLGPDYLWHSEGLNLNYAQSKSGVPFLYGVTTVGECVDDEWAITYVLQQLTLKFPDAFVHLADDDDGQFLLIEAAPALYDWMDPEVCAHRVWLNCGRLVYMPPEITLDSLDTAIDYIVHDRGRLCHSRRIEEAAFARFKHYPAAAVRVNRFRVRAQLPRALAQLLHDRPYYISQISQAIEDQRLLNGGTRSVSRSASRRSYVDIVEVSVHMTRLQYVNLGIDGPETEESAAELGLALWDGFLHLSELKDSAEQQFERFSARISNQGHTMRPNWLNQAFLQSHFYLLRRLEIPRLLKAQTLPSDGDIASWDHATDPSDWLEAGEPFAGEVEGAQGDLDAMVKRLTAILDKETYEGVAESDSDSDSSDSDSDSEEQVVKDPQIDEDDFLEFFLKDALKLTDEEIASYRANDNEDDGDGDDDDDDDDDDDEKEWAQVEEELRKNGVVSDGPELSAEVMHNLMSSLREPGGLTGPAATMLGQMATEGVNRRPGKRPAKARLTKTNKTTKS